MGHSKQQPARNASPLMSFIFFLRTIPLFNYLDLLRYLIQIHITILFISFPVVESQLDLTGHLRGLLLLLPDMQYVHVNYPCCASLGSEQ